MKIRYAGTDKRVKFSDYLGISIYEWDEADYGLTITLFGREFNFLIWRGIKSK
jgi:hypothetical protein